MLPGTRVMRYNKYMLMQQKFLSYPNRISRLYPVFAMFFALTTALFYYAWQRTQIELIRVARFAEQQEQMQKQIENLLFEQKNDKAQLKTQEEKIASATVALAKVEKDLNEKNSALQKAQDQLKNQEAQLSLNASELERLRTRPPLFSFQNQSTLSDIEQKKTDIKQLITDAYSYIEELYGMPYLLNSITITFVDSFTIAGSAGEIVIENSNRGINIDIHLKNFDKNSFQDINTVIHEIIHGFHGMAVFETSALEEGITVAMADAVMERMMKDGKIPSFSHLYLSATESQYQLWQDTVPIYSNNDQFYSSPSVAKAYQVVGTAWYRFYQEDPEFFKKFNASYYPFIQKGNNPDDGLVLDTIRKTIKTVKGESIDTYLSTNKAFNPS